MRKQVHHKKGEKKVELKAENSEPGKVDKKTSPPQESKDTVQSKPDDDHHIQEEKRDGEKDITEEEKKTSPAQESKDTIQSKADDHKENSKVQEKGDGEKIKPALKKPDDDEGEAKTQKLDKNKLSKKVSFSEEPRAPVQKKPATKESGSRTSKLFTMKKTETKKLGKGMKEDLGIGTSKLPSSLKKLELECYPKKEPPVWLNPKTLDNLTKLSIKGGNLSKFSDEPLNAENKCGVEILRLKYLHEFKAEWKDLQTLFPRLKLLEKFKCPKVAFCPTDGHGVWRSHP
ncbi:Leucine-rich repeat (LRR) family protein [Raphanus sativus]|nr:Leucine-rich repeat (LRR) family protein [Raphanus sativus]